MKAWKIKKFIATTLVTAMLLSGMVSFDTSGLFNNSTAQAAVTLHNPTYDSGVREVAPGTQDTTGKLHNPAYDAATDTAEWDCVWFGNYWQSDTNGDGVADEKDEKEPIKWRVLSVDGDDIFLLADKNLDVKPYNETYTDVTWETCTLRSWLNGYGSGDNVCGTDYTSDNFMDNAFSAAEQSVIKPTSVLNEDNPYFDTEGGNDTRDKIYLLSIAEASDPAYGFYDEFKKDAHTRQALNSAYVAEYKNSDMSVGEADYWWLRSPGRDDSRYAALVNRPASVYAGYGTVVNFGFAIRPALHLTLSFQAPLSYAGTVKSTDTATWDCIYFGNYWQSDTNGDGVADKNDEKEPIKWRVLSVDENDVFLLADTNLDVKPYNETDTDVTWETCTLRSWLNGYGSGDNDGGTDYMGDSFMDTAFSAAEQSAMKTTNVINEENPYYGTEGGNNTMDKIYLLSIAEASNKAYGFCSGFRRYSDTRVSLNTAYVAEYSGMNSVSIFDSWWLRSPGEYSDEAMGVINYGCGFSDDVSCDYDAIRPALHLTLSSQAPLSYAGTVCSDGTETDAWVNTPTSAPTKEPTATSTNKPTVAPTSKPTVAPTAKPTAKPTMKPTTPPTSGTPTKQPHATQVPAGPVAQATAVPGQVVKDAATDSFYQILSAGAEEGTVSFIRQETKTNKAKVPAVIYHGGRKYKVTSIAPKAFAGNKKLKTVVIGKNVTKIQKKAFANCKKLSKVTVKSKVLSKVAKNAFKGTGKKLAVKVPKKKRAKYKKLFKGKGNRKLQVK